MCYEDDTTLLYTEDTWEEVHEKATDSLNEIKNWLDINLLTLNINKTKFIIHSS